MNILGHFKTITAHKLLVMGYCFRVGLIRQGLMHDMSKYTPAEFIQGAKYYSGTRSPNAAEREDWGYSTAWMHHKGRNKHHLEYWTDYGGKNLNMQGQPMPTKYMVEMCMDRIAACRIYNGDKYTDKDPLNYLENSRDSSLMHPVTKAQVVDILTMLAEQGEKETLRYVRDVVLRYKIKRFRNPTPETKDPGVKDVTFVSGDELKNLYQDRETPFYLYDEKTIEDRSRAVFDAFAWNSGHRQFFPVKATPTAGILKLLRSLGQGVVCSSAAELELVHKCGFAPEEILFLPNFPREEDMKKAAELGCMPILDGMDLLNDFARFGLLRGTVGLRVNPGGYFRFGGQEVRTDGVKFGLPPDQVKETVKQLKNLGVTSVGLQGYLSGNTLHAVYYPKLAELLLDLAGEISEEIHVEYINISGGLGIPYTPEDTEVDLQAVGQAVEAVFRQKCSRWTGNQPGLYTELGRYITGPGGILVTRVNHVKKTGRSFAGVDASAADLMRPMMYGAYHHISVAGKEGSPGREKWDVVGAVCENTDKFAENRMLPPLSVGDILVIHDAGAHGHSMGYQYGGRLRCAEYLRQKDGSLRLLRRREEVSDYLNTQVF